MVLKQFQNIIKEKYLDCFNELSVISEDDANKISMCESALKFWNFDAILQKYSQEKKIDTLKSPDLLYIEEERAIFVEFKNGVFDSKTSKGTREKIVSGPYIGIKEILEDQGISFNISELWGIPKTYIVVYNPEKSTKSSASSFHGKLRSVKERHSILDRYEGVFADKIYLVSVNLFEEKFLNTWKEETI